MHYARLFHAGRILSGTCRETLNFEEIKMKKKIFLTVFSVLALGIGITVFAYANTGAPATASCCPKGADSCPMKMKRDGQASMSHESCPMKTKDSSGNAVASCCDSCDCCKGDSCPMKHKGDAAKTSTSADGTAASCDCPCCNHDKEKKDGEAAV